MHFVLVFRMLNTDFVSAAAALLYTKKPITKGYYSDIFPYGWQLINQHLRAQVEKFSGRWGNVIKGNSGNNLDNH